MSKVPTIQLWLGNAVYTGCSAIEIDESMEVFASTYAMKVVDKAPGRGLFDGLKLGESAVIKADGKTVVTGYVDEIASEYDAGQRTINLRGFSKAADLVECSVNIPTGTISGKTLGQIARQVCKPYGINVVAATDLGKAFATVTVKQGETIYEFLEGLCRQRAVLALSNATGDLVLTRAVGTTTSQAVDTLALGANIAKATGHFSQSNRYSKYIAKGQSAGGDINWGAATNQQGSAATDPGVSRHRELVTLYEGQATPANLAQYALWQANVRRGRAQRVVVTVPGWTNKTGDLWHINTLVRLEDPMTTRATLIISAIKRTFSADAGAQTELTLTLPEAYELIPISPVGQDIWGAS